MSGSYFSNAGLFLINVLFDLYIIAVVLRILLQLVRADFYNPVCQFVVRITNPLVLPLRRVIPSLGRFDLAAGVLVFLLKLLQLMLAGFLLDATAPLPAIAVFAVASVIQTLVNVFTVTILGQVILSWIDPYGQNPFSSLLHRLNAPLLSPVRRRLPTIGGLDLSPLVVIVALQLAGMLVVAPVFDLGQMLAR